MILLSDEEEKALLAYFENDINGKQALVLTKLWHKLLHNHVIVNHVVNNSIEKEWMKNDSRSIS